MGDAFDLFCESSVSFLDSSISADPRQRDSASPKVLLIKTTDERSNDHPEVDDIAWNPARIRSHHVCRIPSWSIASEVAFPLVQHATLHPIAIVKIMANSQRHFAS